MSAARRAAAVLREPTVARHIPYAAQVSETVIKTFAGDYVQAFRLAGVSFESADDETLSNWHERLNVTWRNIASPNLALEPALVLGAIAEGGHLAPPHQSAVGNLPVSVALAQPHQDLSILEHLESPASHRCPLRLTKNQQGTRLPA